ncbi:MAG: OmpH family outer membrane protein [Bacteroidales bacterium]|nr:OmpH family outer membrane protein [Candidatus Cryptobacteroides aphodequi]
MKKIILVAAVSLLSVSAFAQKFAHVNSAELVQLCPEMDEARTALAAASQEAQETYQEMVEEFQSKYQVYQQKASTWTQTVRETKENELTQIQQRIQEFDQSVQQELQQQQAALLEPIQKKVTETINKLAKEGGYIYVFDVNALMYFDDAQSTDITPAARKALGIPEGRTLETLQAELAAKAAEQQQ